MASLPKMKSAVVALLTAGFAVHANAIPVADPSSEFDWSLLQGQWAESTDHKFGCRPDNVHQWIIASDDRKTLTFKNDRKWDIGSEQPVEQYSASIVRSSKNALIIRYGAELTHIPEKFREWEMRFIGPGTYRWHAAAWPVGAYNDVVGVKCSEQ